MKAKVMEPSAGISNEIHIKDCKRYKQTKLIHYTLPKYRVRAVLSSKSISVLTMT